MTSPPLYPLLSNPLGFYCPRPTSRESHSDPNLLRTSSRLPKPKIHELVTYLVIQEYHHPKVMCLLFIGIYILHLDLLRSSRSSPHLRESWGFSYWKQLPPDCESASMSWC